MQNSKYRKKTHQFWVYKKKCVAVEFWSRSSLNLSNYKFGRNLYIFSGSFCYFCQEFLCFHVINNCFNFIDRSFIVKWQKICCVLVSFYQIIFPVLAQKKYLWNIWQLFFIFIIIVFYFWFMFWVLFCICLLNTCDWWQYWQLFWWIFGKKI